MLCQNCGKETVHEFTSQSLSGSGYRYHCELYYCVWCDYDTLIKYYVRDITLERHTVITTRKLGMRE